MAVARTRRGFHQDALTSLLAALATSSSAACAWAQAPTAAAGRREVIKQVLPGNIDRELTLVEVTYPPGTGSPPHLHANGVMAFVISGAIVSQVGDTAERTYHAGEAWWEPPGAVHRVSRNASSSEPATLLAIYAASAHATAADLMKPL